MDWLGFLRKSKADRDQQDDIAITPDAARLAGHIEKLCVAYDGLLSLAAEGRLDKADPLVQRIKNELLEVQRAAGSVTTPGFSEGAIRSQLVYSDPYSLTELNGIVRQSSNKFGMYPPK